MQIDLPLLVVGQITSADTRRSLYSHDIVTTCDAVNDIGPGSEFKASYGTQ